MIHSCYSYYQKQKKPAILLFFQFPHCAVRDKRYIVLFLKKMYWHQSRSEWIKNPQLQTNTFIYEKKKWLLQLKKALYWRLFLTLSKNTLCKNNRNKYNWSRPSPIGQDQQKTCNTIICMLKITSIHQFILEIK